MQEINTQTQNIIFDDSGIVFCTVFQNSYLDIDDAIENVEAVRQISGGKKVPVLLDIRSMRGIRKQARDFFASEETAKVQSACALLVRSKLSYIIGSFFTGINKTTFPTRMFYQRKDAIDWLKKNFIYNQS